MTVKFTNPTPKEILFSHGNLDGGDVFFVAISPYNVAFYEMGEDQLQRWLKAFDESIQLWGIKYDRL